MSPRTMKTTINTEVFRMSRPVHPRSFGHFGFKGPASRWGCVHGPAAGHVAGPVGPFCSADVRWLRCRFALVDADRCRRFPGRSDSNSHYRGALRRTRLTTASRMIAPRNETTKLAALKLL